MLKTFHIRLRTYRPDRTFENWEDTPYTTVECTDEEIRVYAEVRNRETGREVRINEAGSSQGRYYGGTMSADTVKLMRAIFGRY